MRLSLLVCLFALAACPQVIREAPLTPPSYTATPRATTCHAGAPWVQGPEGWSQADRVCANLNGRPVCCRARSPYGGTRHACVPQAACLPDETHEPHADAGTD